MELAASAGLVLDPWQAQVLIDALGERPDGSWSAFEVGLVVPRQNGKGGAIEARELAGLFLFGEKLIMHSAHEFKTATEAFRRIEELISGCDDMRRRVKRVSNTNGKEGIELRSGARLQFVARSDKSGRGFTGNLNVLDEWFAGTAEQMAALLPTMSAVRNPQIWYTSTPPLAAATELVALRKRGVACEPRVAYFEWSPPETWTPTPKHLPPTGEDRVMWAATNPALGIRISEEFVEGERRAMPDEMFARERLGVWPPEADGTWQVIRESEWRSRGDLSSGIEGLMAFAVDVTPDRKYASIGVAGRRPDGQRHVEVVEHRPGTSWVVARAAELVERHDPCAFVIDASSPAGSLLSELIDAGVEVAQVSSRQLGQACGQLYDGITGDAPDVWHLDQPELAAALSGAMERPLGDSWAWGRKVSTVDISPLVAVTLALWGHATYASTAFEGSLMA